MTWISIISYCLSFILPDKFIWTLGNLQYEVLLYCTHGWMICSIQYILIWLPMYQGSSNTRSRRLPEDSYNELWWKNRMPYQRCVEPAWAICKFILSKIFEYLLCVRNCTECLYTFNFMAILCHVIGERTKVQRVKHPLA